MKSSVERGVDTPSQGQRERAARTVDGVVTELMPSALYRVRLDDGPSVVAHIADRIGRNFVRVLVGDRVRVELSPLDLGRGRIVERLRS
jgi:translation initiation factor IF-1